jgi:hypothetical protein
MSQRASSTTALTFSGRGFDRDAGKGLIKEKTYAKAVEYK